MKPRAFDYVRAETLDEALTALADGGEDAKILAGGQSLVAILNFRLAEPSVLVDITRIQELSYIKADGDMIEIGAAKTQAELQDWPELGDKAPLLAQAIPYLGHFQTRNRGTVCGSLAHSDPSSDAVSVSARRPGGALHSAPGAERRSNISRSVISTV